MQRTSKGFWVRECVGPAGRTRIVFDADQKFIGVEHEQVDTKEVTVRDAKDSGDAAKIAEAAAEFKTAEPADEKPAEPVDAKPVDAEAERVR